MHNQKRKEFHKVEQLQQDLFLFRDTCNVYIIKKGDRALLIDFGSGAVLNALKGMGINHIDRLLHTNYHRDVCGGDHLLDDGTIISVPEEEMMFFNQAEDFWQNKRVYVTYNLESVFFTRIQSVKCQGLRDGQIIEWMGIRFKIISTPADSRHSISIMCRMNGKSIIFCGDVISEPGKVHNIYDYQWDYMPSSYTIFKYWKETLEKLNGIEADMLCPAHGVPMENVQDSINLLISRISNLQELMHPERREQITKPYSAVLPHLIYVDSTSYMILSQSGKGFLIDFGYVDPGCLNRLKNDFGLKKLDVITISHYHDDHICRISEMQYRHGSSNFSDITNEVEIWNIYEMVDILKNPKAYNLPCLFPSNMDTDRIIRSGEKIQWEEFDLYFYHMPGQTEFAMGLFADIDGKRVFFSGDNIWVSEDNRLLTPIIFKNIMYPDNIIRSAEIMLEMRPDVLATGHRGALPILSGMLEGYLEWTKTIKERLYDIVSQDHPLYGIDTQWAAFYPYIAEAHPRGEFSMHFRVMNHYDHDAIFHLVFNLPEDFVCSDSDLKLNVKAKSRGDVLLNITVPFTAQPGKRYIITADITREGIPCGEAAEAIIEIHHGQKFPISNVSTDS